MLPSELRHIKLIPARRIAEALDLVPDAPGIYMFFLAGGARMLEATSYRLERKLRLLSVDGREHMYTGAAHDLRRRMKQHLRRDVRGSSLRKTLFAIENASKAVSKSGLTPRRISTEERLSEWLYQNAFVGIEVTPSPFPREQYLLSKFASPLNITLRRSDAYSRSLMAWRTLAFPRRPRHGRL